MKKLSLVACTCASKLVLLFGLLCASANAAVYPGGEHYIAGHTAEAEARYADALKAYEACAKIDEELAGFARVRMGACRAKAGDVAGAVKHWQALLVTAKNEPWALMARAELGMAFQRQQQHAEAVKHFETVFAQPLTPRWLDAYRRAYGDSLIASSDGKQRESGYLLFESMLEEARTRTQRLEAARRLANAPEVRQRVEAAAAFVYSAEWGNAAGTLNTLSAATSGKQQEFATQIAYQRARIQLAVDSDKEAARTALLAIAKAHPDTEWGRLALMHAARSYHIAGEEPEKKPKNEAASVAEKRLSYRATAEKLFDLLATQLPDTNETAEGLWWLATRHAEHDDDPARVDVAIKTFLKLAEVCPSTERAPEALCRAGWLLMAKGDDATAGVHLLRAAESYPASKFASAAAYDAGRVYLAKKDRETAGKLFRQAVESGGVGNFYAHRAAQRVVELGVKGIATGHAVPTPGTGSFLRALPVAHRPAPAPNEPWLERTRFFASHGYEEAEWEVLAQSHLMMDTQKAGPYLSAVADTGLAATASYIINRTQWGLADKKPLPEAMPALYPRAYWEAVAATARETNSDPLLLLAIARQESLFQAKIESHAGATGVMQLMPSTATWIAKADPEIGASHALNLTKPASSLRLGGFYYRYILGRNGGNAVYAIASYNAGPGNVSKWRNRYPTTDLDTFIESIPFDETRDFVKKVLGNYAAYHSVYSPGNQVAEAEYTLVGR